MAIQTQATITHTPVTVGAVTTAVAAANANRRWLLIVNDSDEAIYVKLGAAAVMNQGIRINPASSSDRTDALPIMSRRQAAGTKAWMRRWCLGANAKTLTVMFGLHEYII